MAAYLLLTDSVSPKVYPIDGREFIIGRQADSDLQLNAREVSRRHARIIAEEQERYFIEDLGSSNGTYLNRERLTGRAPLQAHDDIEIGPFHLEFHQEAVEEPQRFVIRGTEQVQISNTNLFRLDAPRKLQIVLEIAQQLSLTLDPDELFPKLLDQLMHLFMQADRGMIVTVNGDQPRVKAIKSKIPHSEATPQFSRSVVRMVREEGVGIVAEDATMDSRFDMTQTLSNLGIRSFLCVPFKTRTDKAPAMVILDRFGVGLPFTQDDLQLLTAVCLQASVVLENARLHVELMQKAKLERDVALARKIQEDFLPKELPLEAVNKVDYFARVFPAREVAGDYYDFFAVDDQRLAFSVADISGKGIPAALMMSGIRSLCRHLTEAGLSSPAEILQRINDTLAIDNPRAMFVTMIMGFLDYHTGDVLLASAGHPPVLVRRAAGQVEQLAAKPGRLLGATRGHLPLADSPLRLEPGDAIILYTDGVIEARSPAGQLFGLDQLLTTLRDMPPNLDLEATGNGIKERIDQFSGPAAMHDDITLLLLKRLHAAKDA